MCTVGGCAAPEAAAACANVVDGQPCTASSIAAGTCSGGSCHPVGCGNGIIDAGEVCDDGNTVAGDGCSADCRSNETCGNDVVDTIDGEQCDSGVFGLSGDGCTSRCTTEIQLWRDVTPLGPSPRSFAGISNDRQGRLIVVDGQVGLQQPTPATAGTWAWTGDAWGLLDPGTELPARGGFGIAYDAARQRTIAFGGSDGTSANAETWAWDGVTWTQLHPATSPSARYYLQLAYDQAREKIVLFGGFDDNGDYLGDTWEWDGTTWTQRTPTQSPPARAHYSMAYDAVAMRTVMFGGQNSVELVDLWEYDGTTWTSATPPGDGNTELGGMTFDGSKLVLDTFLATWTRTGTTWTELPTHHATFANAIGFDPISQRVISFGGNIDIVDTAAETWRLFNGTWTLLAPPTVQSVGATYDAARGLTLGFGADGLWAWDGSTWKSEPSGPVINANIAYDARRHVAVVFTAGTTWLWDGTTWTTPTTAHAPPSAGPMIFDDARGTVVMIASGQTWEWNGTDWTQASGVPPTGAVAISYDPVRDRVVLVVYSIAVTETWEWDGTTWTQVAPSTTPPGERFTTGLVYAPLIERVVLFGGQLASGGVTDTWLWDGTTWTQASPVIAIPDGITSPVIATDSTGGLVVFSGIRGTILSGSVWRMRFESPTVAPERCADATADTDGDGLAGCADPDCYERCAPFCPPGVSCDLTQPYCGDGTCSPVEDYLICPADCARP